MAVSLDSLRKAVKKNKGRSQALAWLADMERAAGDYEAALKTVDAALAASPSDVPAMLVRAKILAGQQDFAGSITEYKKVLAKDPFCLSAHKRMGESYDKLGKEAERNACFRRVHDMDPLDPFWKDEYDVLPEEETLVPPVMDDSSFTMDVSDDTENAETGEDNIFANLAASLPNTDEEDNTSMEALRNSLNFASDEIAQDGDAAQDASFEGHALNSSEVSSAISDILGGDDDLEVVDSSEKNEPAAEEPATSSLFSHFSDEKEKIDAIEEPKSEEVTEEKSDDAEFSLDSLDEPLDADEKSTNVDDAFSSLLGDDELPEEAPAAEQPVEQSAEEQPAEELSAEQVAEPVAENLGAPEEEPTDAENLAGMNNVPAMHMDFSDDEDVGVADDVFDLDEPAKAESKAEEAETNVDDAFSSLLGDDELPEEKDSASSTADATGDAEIATEEVAEPALETQSEEQADVEKPLEESVEDSFGSLFEKSADADFSLDSEAPAAEENAEKPLEESVEKPEEESAEGSFSSLFEKSADADFSLEKAPEFVPNESAENVAPAEGLVPTSHMDFSDDEDIPKADDDFVLNLDEELPTESETPVAENVAETQVSESLEEPAEETLEEQPADIEKPAEEIAENVAEEVVEAPAESLENVATADDESAAEEVDGAFDALFGDDDEAPAEASAETPVDASTSSATENVDEIAETPVEEQPAIEQPVTESFDAESPVEESPKDEDLAKEMGGAFASMFGEDDSMPTESAPVDAPASETTESVEEPLSQEATSAEFEEEAVKEDVEKSVDESFDSIFGADADDLPEEKSEVAEAPADASTSSVTENIEETAAPAEEPTSVFSAPAETLEEPSDVTLEEPAAEQLEEPVAETAEPVAEEAPSAELDSIDSEVSNAFKGLFDEDDSLPESDEPNNNGVDYLMSGDSDDEVAASLVENADAPLSRGATDLDDSLNTRTLADIYMEQGVYDKALDIYTDLAKKNPDNEKIKSRLEEVKKLYREKFGEV